MIQRLREKFRALHGAAIGASACGCGAGAHFMAHPCIEHALVALIAFAIGAWAFLKGIPAAE